MDITSSGSRWRSGISIATLVIAVTLLATCYLLLSPPAGASFPGAIPWADGSLLKAITDAQSLGGAVPSARGTELKDFAFQVLASIGLIALALRAIAALVSRDERPIGRGPWLIAQVFLVAWVGLSALSVFWARDWTLAYGQAALYGFGLAWAVTLAWTLEGRDIPRLLWSYVVIAAVGAILCIVYYHVRNPNHRPGFPIGNPSTLAACTLPALILVITWAVGAGITAWQQRDRTQILPIAAACICLVPLLWCFLLTDSRGSQVGLLAGAGGIAFMLAPRSVRWWAGALMPLILLAGWWVLASNQDLAMARGATIRFRVYAWQYAAMLWWDQAVIGHGAGSFATLASGLATRDRALDPAAFLGDSVEHAHNELFEVLTEIGLVGGLTFVGGYVATMLAAAAMLRANMSPQRRFLMLGMVAGLIGLMADAMFGVGLRLAVVPAVFYTLLGVLWAACRTLTRDRTDEPSHRLLRPARIGVAIAAAGCAIIGVRLSWQNWQGALIEQQGAVALANGQAPRAVELAVEAETLLLDPVRKLVANELAIRSATQQAMRAAEEWRATAQDASERRAALAITTIAQAEAALTAAVEFNRRAPGFGRPAMYGARCAELLIELNAGDQKKAAEWWLTAAQAWRELVNQRRYDPTALLALTRYASSTADLLGFLRDALRDGLPSTEWRQAMQRAAAQPDFVEVLTAMSQTVAPYGAETEPDTLILSSTPEMHRLAAFAAALRGDWANAEAAAARAAALYKPLRLRFTELESVAIAEQTDFGLRDKPDDARRWIALLNRAIEGLPRIQAQKYAEMVSPYRLRLAVAQLVAGDEAAARAALGSMFDGDALEARLADMRGELAVIYVMHPRSAALPIDDWIAKSLAVRKDQPRAWLAAAIRAKQTGGEAAAAQVLGDAAAAGLREADLEPMRRAIDLVTTRPASQ
ncbi:MAG: O-antigen ligase family protein [Phycisphaerae bacterium]